jgi:hypothetical protein
VIASHVEPQMSTDARYSPKSFISVGSDALKLASACLL